MNTKKKVLRYIEKMKKSGQYIGLQRVCDTYVVYFYDKNGDKAEKIFTIPNEEKK
jgi:hypothetical protein